MVCEFPFLLVKLNELSHENTPMERQYKLSDFHHLEEIARGRVGSIHLVKEKATGKRFVLKKRLRSECRGEAEHEARLLRKIKHPNVIKCYGYFKTSSLGRSPVYIVLEYAANGDLRKLIRERGEREKLFGETRLWTMYRQILRGLQHLHSHNIIHRDIKSSNIFLMKNSSPRKGWKCVLGDFGVSRERSETTSVLTTFYGTPLYASPELIRSEPYNEKTDVWSCGVVFYELATLDFPFFSNNLLNLAKKIERGTYKPIQNYSPSVSRVVDMMLRAHSESRASTSELLSILGDDDVEDCVVGDDEDDDDDDDDDDTVSGEDTTTEDEEEKQEQMLTEKQPVPILDKSTATSAQRPVSRRDLRWEQRRNSRNRGREHIVIDRRRNRSVTLPRFGQQGTLKRPSTAHSQSSSFSSSFSSVGSTGSRNSTSSLARLQRLSFVDATESNYRRPQSKRTSGWFLRRR